MLGLNEAADKIERISQEVADKAFFSRARFKLTYLNGFYSNYWWINLSLVKIVDLFIFLIIKRLILLFLHLFKLELIRVFAVF